MAIDTGGSKSPRRRPAFTKNTYSCVVRGQEIARKWPVGRKGNIHPKTAAQMEWFRQAQWAFKLSAPRLQQAFTEACAGSPLLPRDVFTMGLAQRLFRAYAPGGRKIYPMATVTGVSDSLDALSQVKGTMLIRGEELWTALTPPDLPNYVLATQGPGLDPAWIELPEEPDFEFGDYTPTLTAIANVTSPVAVQCHYFRFEDFVYVWGGFGCTYNNATLRKRMQVSIPFPTTMGGAGAAVGAAGNVSATPVTGLCYGVNVAGGMLEVQWGTTLATGSVTMLFAAAYRII